MTQMYRMRRKFQRGLCPFDDTIAELKGGLQRAPKWLRSVRKYPPAKMWLTPGAIARPSEFFNDEIRKLMLKNRRRPDWIPSLFGSNSGSGSGSGSPSTSSIMSGAQFQDAFDCATFGMDPDIEFAACQAWFMQKRNMDENEAYVQTRFKMRDLIKQKQRVWEVYRRTQMLTETERKREDISLTDGWIQQIKSEMSKNALTVIEKQHAMKQEMHAARAMQPPADSPLTHHSRLGGADAGARDGVGGGQQMHTHPQTHTQQSFEDEHTIKRLKDEIEFDKEWEENLRLLRFIEYSDYIAQNPHLGIRNPTQLLTGIPNRGALGDAKKRLLIKMANKKSRIKPKYLTTVNRQQQSK